MHYVPESSRDFLPADGRLAVAKPRSIHYQSAPLYVLTLAVGALILLDLLAALTGTIPSGYAGYRWALWAAVLGGSRILYHTLDELSSGKIGAGLALTIAFAAAVWLGESMTAALVVFITLTGECVERYTIDLAQAAIRNVFDLYPPAARVLRDGREHDCPVSELQPSDVVAVRPGERLPADGRVVSGESSIDQSLLTGESQPIEVTVGDEVYAGTHNQFGAINYEVLHTGSNTVLGQITETIAAASQKKTTAERTADRLARWFLPIVLLTAATTFCGWWLATGNFSAGWEPTLGVLVVACPCALVLATPTAVMAALAWLARAGIVVKGSEAIERLAAVDVFAFDKTGTLTRGELQIGSIFPINKHTEFQQDQLLYLVAVAEQLSEHPIAVPFANYAQSQNWQLPTLKSFTATVASGVTATVLWDDLQTAWQKTATAAFPKPECLGENPEWTLQVGKLRWVDAQGLQLDKTFLKHTEALDSSGETGLILVINGQCVGAIGLQDAVREEAAAVLAKLKELGLRETILLTGDRPAATHVVAAKLALDHIHAELLPKEKADWITKRQASGYKVAMVGDGINDAPALVAADVGIALARRHSHLASEAGDVVFLSGNLQSLPQFVRLSRAMVQNIRQSILLFAFGLNGLGILLCGMGVLSPVWAAVLHEAGSLAVMLNAMRLLWFDQSPQANAESMAFRASQWAEWLTAAFSPTRWVYGIVDRWNVLLRLAAAGLAAAWFCSNIVLVRHDEAAIVTRFGKVHTELQPGWHWRWPAPLESVYRTKPQHVRTLTFGFRPKAFPIDQSRPRVIDWTSPHEKTGEEPVPEESLLLTADEVPIELTAEIPYRIAHLGEFSFGNADVEESLRAITGHSLRSLIARTSLDDILTTRRAGIERECLARLCERAGRFRLGIEILDVQFVEVHPPRGVIPAYRDVANAWEEKELSQNAAQAAANSRLQETIGPRGLAQLQAALNWDFAKPAETPHSLTDEAWNDVARLQAVEDEVSLIYLSGETAAILLAAKGEAFTKRKQAQGVATRFRHLHPIYREHPELTAWELYWKTLETILDKQPLTILDPKAAGRRQLLLGNATIPDPPPLPMLSLPGISEKAVDE